jgi:uncharacterized repeat protein (TIGR02543 family)
MLNNLKTLKTLKFLTSILTSIVLAGCGNTAITINFESNGGTIVQPLNTYTNSTIELPKDPTKEGYVFSGWYFDNNTFANLFNTNTLTESSISEDFTLYAKWLTPFDSFYDSISGRETNFSSDPLGPYKTHVISNYNGDYVVRREINFYKNGNDIHYSYYRRDGQIRSGTIYEQTFTTTIKTQIQNIQNFDIIMSETRITKPPTGAQRTTVSKLSRAQNVSLLNLEYLVSFSFNNGDFTSENAQPYVRELYSNLKKVYPALLNNLTLTQYTISFETNGGSVIPSITGNYGDPVNLISTPFREGYTFSGWYSNFSLTQIATIPKVIPSQNITFYAKWNIRQYAIRFNSNGGNSLPAQVYNFGANLNIPTPTRSGHTFIGWYLDANLLESFLLVSMPSNDLMLYAKWSINQYSISYNSIIFDKIIQISVGDSHSLALMTSGRVFSWGLNNYGQLGDGTSTNKGTPTMVVFNNLQNGESINSVSAGENHSLAVTTTGRVFSWGLNNYGQLGDGTSTNKGTPTMVVFNNLQNGESINSVSAGDRHSLAVTTNGRVSSWGWNAAGQLGDGTNTQRNLPIIITISGLQIGETILSVNAGYVKSHAVTTNGRVFAWGFNGSGQLGDGTEIDKNIPIQISFNGLHNEENIKSIKSNMNNATIAITSNGRIYSWGFNGNGQLGHGNTTTQFTPTIISFPNLQGEEKIESFDLGSYHSIAITTYGRLYSAGFNGEGQLGNGVISNTETLIPTIQIFEIKTSASEVESYVLIEFNQAINLPNPILEGYVFEGWYLDENLTIEFDVKIMPAANLILYAWFTPINN